MAWSTGTGLWVSAGTGVPIRWVLVRPAGAPTGPLSAFLSTDTALDAATILPHYSQRWALETAFAQVRAHLGVVRALFSLVTLLAHGLHQRGLLVAQRSACYAKAQPTFSDALACVRR